MKIPILAIDPGREKCGVAAVEADGSLLWCEIWTRLELESRLQVLATPKIVVVGNATASREIVQLLGEIWPQIEAQIIDERGSTLEARDEYWRHHPPRGWRRVVPISLQNPPCSIDDYAALIIARRWLRAERKEKREVAAHQ